MTVSSSYDRPTLLARPRICFSDNVWSAVSFSVSLKFGACSSTDQWSEFRAKNAFHIFICNFLLFIVKFEFLSLSFLFWWSIKFPQQNINQPEARICDKTILIGSVCLTTYASMKFRKSNLWPKKMYTSWRSFLNLNLC